MRRDFRQIIYSATRAPSAHNTQPWKFSARENYIFIYPDYTRSLPVADPDHHELFISLGCALENLVIAAEHFSYHPRVKIINDPSTYIRVELTDTVYPKQNLLFRYLESRQTTRNKYDGTPIPEEHLDILDRAAAESNTRMQLITRREVMEVMIDLVKEACARQYSNPAYLQELVEWVRFNDSKAERTQDGLFSQVTGNSKVPEWFGKLFLKISLTPEREAVKQEEFIRSSSALAVFISHGNRPSSWISLGRSFERFAVAATALKIHHAHHNIVCEDVVSRKKLAKLLSLNTDEYPLLFVRVGYSDRMKYSLRRPLEDVIGMPAKELVL